MHICTVVCTAQLKAKICIAILKARVEMFLQHMLTYLKIFACLLHLKYFQNLCHSALQCVHITLRCKGTSVFPKFQCETLYNVVVYALCKHYALFNVNHALCTIHRLWCTIASTRTSPDTGFYAVRPHYALYTVRYVPFTIHQQCTVHYDK